MSPSVEEIPMDQSFAELFESCIACVILFVLGSITIACSVYTIALFITRPKQRTSFTLICTTRGIFHLANALIYGPYCGLILVLTLITGEVYSTPFSIMSQIAWFALTPIEFVLSLKRQMAVSFPLKYRIFFSQLHVKVLMATCTLGALVFWFFRLHQGCFFFFYAKHLDFEYTTPECEAQDVWLAQYVMLPLQVSSISLNFLTLYNIVTLPKKSAVNALTRRRYRINYRLCMQLVIQNTFWCASTLAWLPQSEQLFDARLWKFLCRIGIQLTTHSIESLGFAMLHIFAS